MSFGASADGFIQDDEDGCCPAAIREDDEDEWADNFCDSPLCSLNKNIAFSAASS